MGVTVTFVAILELVREGLIEIVQAEPFAPLHVRAAPRSGYAYAWLKILLPDEVEPMNEPHLKNVIEAALLAAGGR